MQNFAYIKAIKCDIDRGKLEKRREELEKLNSIMDSGEDSLSDMRLLELKRKRRKIW